MKPNTYYTAKPILWKQQYQKTYSSKAVIYFIVTYQNKRTRSHGHELSREFLKKSQQKSLRNDTQSNRRRMEAWKMFAIRYVALDSWFIGISHDFNHYMLERIQKWTFFPLTWRTNFFCIYDTCRKCQVFQ